MRRRGWSRIPRCRRRRCVCRSPRSQRSGARIAGRVATRARCARSRPRPGVRRLGCVARRVECRRSTPRWRARPPTSSGVTLSSSTRASREQIIDREPESGRRSTPGAVFRGRRRTRCPRGRPWGSRLRRRSGRSRCGWPRVARAARRRRGCRRTGCRSGLGSCSTFGSGTRWRMTGGRPAVGETSRKYGSNQPTLSYPSAAAQKSASFSGSAQSMTMSMLAFIVDGFRTCARRRRCRTRR